MNSKSQIQVKYQLYSFYTTDQEIVPFCFINIRTLLFVGTLSRETKRCIKRNMKYPLIPKCMCVSTSPASLTGTWPGNNHNLTTIWLCGHAYEALKQGRICMSTASLQLLQLPRQHPWNKKINKNNLESLTSKKYRRHL